MDSLHSRILGEHIGFDIISHISKQTSTLVIYKYTSVGNVVPLLLEYIAQQADDIHDLQDVHIQLYYPEDLSSCLFEMSHKVLNGEIQPQPSWTDILIKCIFFDKQYSFTIQVNSQDNEQKEMLAPTTVLEKPIYYELYRGNDMKLIDLLTPIFQSRSIHRWNKGLDSKEPLVTFIVHHVKGTHENLVDQELTNTMFGNCVWILLHSEEISIGKLLNDPSKAPRSGIQLYSLNPTRKVITVALTNEELAQMQDSAYLSQRVKAVITTALMETIKLSQLKRA